MLATIQSLDVWSRGTVPESLSSGACMTLSAIYIATCIATLSAVLACGAPAFVVLVYASAVAIALLGVPHGALDHWTGRRLLAPWLSKHWWIAFFPAYLAVAIAFASAWYFLPIVTVAVFFLASAWHFGREDQKASANQRTNRTPLRIIDHLAATAVGGLVLWIPAWLRADEMQSLLALVVPSTDFQVAQKIVSLTQSISLVFIPLAGATIAARIIVQPRELRSWVPLATAALAALTPILLSFSLFFCGWHSIQGLQHLQQQEQLSNSTFLASILPLSLLAVFGIMVAGWWFHSMAGELTDSGRGMSGDLQTLFIGLSAIAVPHLLLHELEDRLAQSQFSSKVLL